jgi:hypothetical protein
MILVNFKTTVRIYFNCKDGDICDNDYGNCRNCDDVK